MRYLEGVLLHPRALVAGALAMLVVLAWVYVWTGAGMGMSALEMTSVSLFPHLHDAPGEMEFSWPIVIAMWWVMMIAMMTPAAAPFVLLHSRLVQSRRGSARGMVIEPLLVVAGYLAVWLAFSIAAATLQAWLQPAGWISSMMLWSKSPLLSAAVLAAAGIYQFTPLKRACLAQCRGPIEFLSRYWRPGRFPAFALGMRHGAFCVGCCWMLMALLFVFGVMNLVWIAALAILVLLEKLAPAGERIAAVTGIALLGWAGATLLIG